MSETEVPFYAQTAILDAYLKSNAPDSVAVKVIIEALRADRELERYFFRNTPHPAWVGILRENDFFRTPPAPEKYEDRTVFPHWEAQEYLISVADKFPTVLLEHFKLLKDQPQYGGQAIRALEVVGGRFVKAALPQLLEWLNDAFAAQWTAVPTYKLAVKLAELGEATLAFALFRAVTAPQPPQNVKKFDDFFLGTRATSLLNFDSYHFGFGEDGELASALKKFQTLDIRQLVSILEDHLLNALRLEAEAEESNDYENRSFWRTAIEDSSQDIGTEYKDKLLVLLRNTLRAWCGRDAEGAEAVVNRFLSDKHEILRRLGLYILGEFPMTYRPLVSRELLSETNLDDVGVHHEYFLLLEKGYPQLEPAKRAALIDLIRKGPDAEKIERIVRWANDERAGDVDGYTQNYVKRWMRDRLWMLKDNLETESLQFLNQLVEETGKPDHAEYTHWSSGAYFVNEVSPQPFEELSLLSPDELVGFLQQWKPEPESAGGAERTTQGGLARAAATVVFSNFEKYVAKIEDIALIAPAFAVSLLERFKSDLPANPRWTEALRLCSALLEKPEVLATQADSPRDDWRGVRLTIVDLIEKGLEKNEAGVSVELSEVVRDLLFILLEDSDPEPESEQPSEGSGDFRDPATTALNRVRPRALSAIVYYVYHRLTLLEKANGGKIDASNRLEENVSAAIARRLEAQIEPSAAVRSVFGRFLPNFYWLDRDWLLENLDRILPEADEPESNRLFVAAWYGFTAFNGYNPEVFDLLRPKYKRAIANLAAGLTINSHLQATKNMAGHLLWNYLRGNETLNESGDEKSLLAQFFQIASPETRRDAGWVLWRICHDNPEKFPEMWERVKTLWEQRVAAAARENHASDFDGEMEWYARLPLLAFELETISSLWSLLEGTLPHIARLEHFNIGWESLEELLVKEVKRSPLRAIQFYHLMYQNISRPHWYSRDEKSRRIIEAAAAAAPESRREALALINTLARMGNHQFRDIYQRFTK